MATEATMEEEAAGTNPDNLVVQYHKTSSQSLTSAAVSAPVKTSSQVNSSSPEQLELLGALTAQLAIPKERNTSRCDSKTTSSHPIDPLTAMPFVPIDHRLVTMMYHSDDGWFLQSFAGFLFFCSREIRPFPPSPPATGTGIKLGCPKQHLASLYTHVYNRWAETNALAYNTLQRLCYDTPQGRVLKVAPCKALFEGRETLALGVSIDEVKKHMAEILNGPEPIVDELTQQTWQLACLDETPKLQGYWINAVTIPWKNGEGDKNNRQVVIPRPWPDNHDPSYLHPVRYIRPLPLDRAFQVGLLGEQVRDTNKNMYSLYLLKVKARARLVTRLDLEPFAGHYQPRPQNCSSLVQARPLIRTGADALLSPQTGKKRPRDRDDDQPTKSRRMKYDEYNDRDQINAYYCEDFPDRFLLSRRMSEPQKPKTAQPNYPPRYHRVRRQSHRVESADEDSSTTHFDDSSIMSRPSVDDFLNGEEKESQDSLYWSSNLSVEELQESVEESAKMGHHQCELDTVYTMFHMISKYKYGKSLGVPFADERMLYNPKQYE
ncbi:Hypothetical protein D9617_7g029780 [Elsinoe fawcettii]|nr:Hypothetical protein D9617_7g029780 [Elsinoe fawcettii]